MNLQSPWVLLKAAWEIVELAFVVGSLYLAMRLYVRHRQPTWTEPLDRRRVAVLWLLALGATATKITEDALAGESGPIDEGIMLFLHSQVPLRLTEFFEAVSLSASAPALISLTIAGTIALVIATRRFEATLLVSSVIASSLVVYAMKVIVGRERPALWDTQWYWGSSFPSGHTLVVAAFAAASALILSRLWPIARKLALSVALLWILLVAFSRMILGVHWPTDVLAAACVGTAIPLGLRFLLEMRKAA